MSINGIQGLSKIGWVVAIPLGALIILASNENTKEFSSSIDDVTKNGDWGQSIVGMTEWNDKQMIESSALGHVDFSREAPKEVVDKVNKIKLAGLITSLILTFTLLIQGSMLLFAWILRAFKGTSNIAETDINDTRLRARLSRRFVWGAIQWKRVKARTIGKGW